MPHKPGTGAIFGIVSEDGLVKTGSPVTLIDPRRDADGVKRIIGRQLTDDSGGFRFAGLDTGYTDYMLLATDEDGAEPKNALVQDRVQPIAAHSGEISFDGWLYQASKHAISASIINSGFIGDNTYPELFSLYGQVNNYLDRVDVTNEVISVPNAENLTAALLPGTAMAVVMGRRNASRTAFTEKTSLEVLINLDSLVSEYGRTVFAPVTKDGSSNSSYAAFVGMEEQVSNSRSVCLPALSFEAGGNQLLVVMSDNNQFQNGVILGTIDISALTGWHHFVLTRFFGGAWHVYDNGVVIATDTTGAAFVPENYVPSSGVYQLFAGTTSNTNNIGVNYPVGGRCQFALVAHYNKRLSAQEVAELYDSLYGAATTANLTGMSQAILSNLPSHYFQMDVLVDDPNRSVVNMLSTNEGVPAHWGTDVRFTASEANLDLFHDSPRAGKNALAWSGSDGSFTSTTAGTANFTSRTHAALHCWHYANDTLPATQENLVVFGVYQHGSRQLLALRRLTNGHYQLEFRDSAAILRTSVFDDYTSVANTWQNLVVNIAAVGTEVTAELFVGTEAAAPTLVSTKTQAGVVELLTLDGYKSARIDANNTIFSEAHNSPARSSLTIGSGGFSGSIIEVALFPRQLSADDIQAIWVAKDVV